MTTAIDPAGQGTGTGTDPQSGTEGSNTDPTTAQSGSTTGEGSDAKTTVSREDFERIQNQLRAADQRRDAAEKRAKALEDAKLSEAERTTKQLEETKAENAQLQARLKDLQIQNAFVTDNTHDWHDSRAALKLADLSGVEIGDDGTVKGLKEALEAVAKAHPYLLKPKEAEGEAGATTPTAPKPAGVTGVAGAGTGGTGTDKGSLAKKFPQLAGRVS